MVMVSVVAMIMSRGCDGKGGDYDCGDGDHSIGCNDNDVMVLIIDVKTSTKR